MNRSLALAIAVVCFAASAVSAPAADMPRARPYPSYNAPVEPPFSWAGFYFGINGGYGWGRSSWSDPAFGANSGMFNTSGALVGGQLGYNWQTGSVVLGIETDADWANINGSTAALGVCLADGGGTCQTKQDWFGTTRGRIGYAFGRFMPYVTGGAAYGDIKALQTTGNAMQTQFGWSAGGGLEYSLDRNWSAKVEYLHLDLGTASLFSVASGTSSLSVPITDNIVRAGINYHW